MTTARGNVERALSHFYLKFNGQAATNELAQQLREVTIESSLHLPDVATLVIRDAEVEFIDDDNLSLGCELEIHAGVAGNEGLLFHGEIVEVEPRFTQHDQHLVLRAFDRLHRLARGTHTRSFQNVSDMDLVRKIAAETGLQAEVGPASFVHDYVFQNNQTNLAFLQERAAKLGYLLYVEGRTLCCVPPKPQGQAVELKWGVNLAEFIPRLSSLNQPSKTITRGWDPQTKKAVVGQAAKAQGAPATGERRASEDAATAFNMQPVQTLTQHVVRQQAVADVYAQASANRSAERLIEATGACGGNPAITAGVPLKISAVGERFSGVYYASSVTHTYHTGRGYSTEFSVSGQQPAGLAAALGVSRPDYAQRGLAIGIVTNNQDPENQGRVKVKYPGLTEEHESFWARTISVGGGAQRGTLHLPEVNDEVLIGFELGDIHHPYVLGGLWNGVDAPPKPTGELVQGGEVVQRVTRSRQGHWFILDDTQAKGYVQLQTAKGHQIRLHDENGREHILIEDKSGNTIKLDSTSNTLTVQVKGDAKVNANGHVNVSANGNVDVQALGSLKAQATNIELNGSASVKISGGVVEVKGGLIKLN